MIYRRVPLATNAKHGVTLTVDAPIDPEKIYTTLETLRDYFQLEADGIEAELFRALPGGLYDALLGAMFKRKASVFVVSHGERK